MNETCPNDPALATTHNFVFNTSRTVTDSFNQTAGSLSYGGNGAEFTINKRHDSPTIQSNFYIFFGSVSVIMRAATGQGIISSIVLQSDDLDEIDWEFMGGNATTAQSNYFGKGNTTSFDRAVYHQVEGDVRENFHNYTTDWTAEKIDFYIDGNIVRTLPYAAANGGKNFPQTPCNLRLGIWAGGDESLNKYTIEWAGGLTDYSKAPFTMFVQSAHVQDYSSGKEYQWTDRTGSWESIKSISGNSTAAVTIEKTANEKPALSIAQKFAALSPGAKIAVYCSGGGAAALVLSALLFVCIRQRRAGRKERDAYNAKVEKEREDAYRDQMELREKGLGGWDKNAYATQGDDALGGWGGTHATTPVPKIPFNVMVSEREIPSRSDSASPAISRAMTSSPATIGRAMSPTVPNFAQPFTQSPQQAQSQPHPRSPQQWSGNQGGMIQNAGNSYSGGYGGNPNGYSGGNMNPQREPSFGQVPQQQRGFGNGGYQRF